MTQPEGERPSDGQNEERSGRVVALIPAAGRGVRLGLERPKAFVELNGRTLLARSVAAVRASGVVDEVVLVVPPELVDVVRGEHPETTVVAGGAERSDSVRAGLAAAGDADLILVHDAARALTPPSSFTAVVEALRGGRDAVVPGLPVVDTLKRVDADGTVRDTPARGTLRAVQTPQGFAADVLRRAHAGAAEATDDAGLVEALGVPVQVIDGDALAFKITAPHDLRLAKLLLAGEEIG
ncbi:MAG: 2-C-methyl-D-erythritol 4-phosphate cytidylyltransferase [Gordonia sp. (in: high G+C Gram-positive bacteria)]|uniref:2-C-methyl-D-erythritol 4-phosphate cytidylyltransferase n=1 Tax=Gordonia sp. (in: high G+C Gram-positive bacteria) TaxID=84139 RepID=UPI0039E674FC